MNGPHFAAQPAAPAQPTARPAPARPAAKPADRPREAAPAAGMVLTYLRLHWMTILFCGALLGSGLAYLAWTLLPSKYESYALLQVASTPQAIAETGDPNRNKTAFATYVKTQAQLIKSDFVLNAALNDAKYRIADLPTLKDQKDPIKYLDEKLVVAASEGNEVVKISLEGERPEDVRKIVDAVKDAYYREVVEKELKQRMALKVKVEEAKADLAKLIEQRAGPKPGQPALAANNPPQPATPAGGVMQIPVAPPVVPGVAEPGGGVQPAGATVPVPPAAPAVAVGAAAESDMVKRAKFALLINQSAQLEREQAQFPVWIQEKTAAIESLKKQLAALTQGPPSVEALAAAEKDPEYLAADARAQKAQRDFVYLRAVAQDPNSEPVKRLERIADTARKDADKVKFERARQVETARRQAKADDLVKQLDAAEQALRSMQERERVSKKMLEDTRKELAEMPPDPKKVEEKGPLADPNTTDVKTLDGLYARLTAQAVGLEYELKSPARVQVLQPASTPSLKDTKKQIFATVFAGLMGFALVGLVAVGYETRAKKVSSLAELKAAGPSTVVGVVPWTPDGAAARDPVKRADVNEAIDKLRAYVAQTWLARGATTVAVTSPLGDEGKAFTAFGLASSLAQAGYKTLLVDFDLRNPSLHPLAGVPNGTGVCELLRGEADPRGAVLALPNGLGFLPAGKWSDEARQAAVGGRLEALLTRLREPFDCVVLHGHALLTVAESVEIARRSEVVLLCTLYRETRLPLLKRAAERLTAMEVPYSGVVYLGATAHEALC